LFFPSSSSPIIAAGQSVPTVSRAHHDEGGTVRFCLPTRDGHEIESVIIPMGRPDGGWKSLCVSTQIGCGRACAFCRSGQGGLIRNLTVDEMLGQARAATQTLLADIRNVVFMGMGEPLDNIDNVIEAVRRFQDAGEFGIARRRIAISTVGRCDGIRRLASLGWRRLGLAVSLNASNDDVRSRIMPINHLEPMARLREAIAAYPVRAGGHVLIEYVLLAGVNDLPEHARELATYLSGLPTCVNLIAWNPCDGIPFRTPDAEAVGRFKQILMDAGQLVFERSAKGRGAMGACGQLGGARGLASDSEDSP
jgi:23S rRNA (adenine2503-C2)-methyltransferase